MVVKQQQGVGRWIGEVNEREGSVYTAKSIDRFDLTHLDGVVDDEGRLHEVGLTELLEAGLHDVAHRLEGPDVWPGRQAGDD